MSCGYWSRAVLFLDVFYYIDLVPSCEERAFLPSRNHYLALSHNFILENSGNLFPQLTFRLYIFSTLKTSFLSILIVKQLQAIDSFDTNLSPHSYSFCVWGLGQLWF